MMAKQITQIEKHNPSQAEEREEAIRTLVDMTADNHESLMLLLEVIKEVKDAEVLDMARGFLRTRDKIGAIAVEQINQPNVHRVVQAGTQAFQFLGKVDPKDMEILLAGVANGLDRTSKGIESDEKLSLWGMAKSLRDPDINASMQTMFGFLKGMGEALNNHKPEADR
ncbi:DUF1641 domain-containing protein [Thalassorhabdus alkalitolerans]|uniref:DUF1641 domain-containing protein n=1 Tax=Thalassorhabdus alkalitolerans TaxID=2282697 RepID=A0ABW0YRJ9_9BACI|nr:MULTISPECIES: DUF1641 domain-containing protein [Bacillaceae]